MYVKDEGRIKGEKEEEFSALTWYVLSKLSYINLVINEVFPTEKERKKG